MKSLSFTEFRNRASEILTLVEKGETVRIIRHGKTVAKIVPAESEEKIPSCSSIMLARPKSSSNEFCNGVAVRRSLWRSCKANLSVFAMTLDGL